jgi:SAM-dependent methyltransferase
VPDALFADPRLAPLYDAMDGPRVDLDHYVAIAQELGARSALDVGAGTGCLALRLADEGLEVVGVDPAQASLDVARGKRGADRVRWIAGTTRSLSRLEVDLALMTGNVAQVFLEEDEWTAVLADVHRSLRPGGHLAFETRRPEARVWEAWGEEPGQAVVRTPSGVVTRTFTLTEVDLPFVSFRHDYDFPDGTRVVSRSTLRFRGREEIERTLARVGFRVVDVREAPDRPRLEHVFVARKPGAMGRPGSRVDHDR